MSIKYAELRFRPNGGGQWYPNTFREWLAKATSEDPENKLPQELFWYQDGKNIESTTKVNFCGSKKYVGLNAHPEYAQMLYSHGWKIVRLLNKHFGGSHSVEMLDRELIAELKEQGIDDYYVANLAIQTNLCDAQGITRAKQGDTDYVIDLLHKQISKSFLRQGAEIGLSQINPMNIRFEKLAVDKTKNGMLFLVVKGVHFSLRHRLYGPWYAGVLTARGYGETKLKIGEKQGAKNA